MTTSIINQLMDACEVELTKVLITDIPVGDETRAGLVQSGRLLEDPTETDINVMVYPGDIDWRHELNTYTTEGSGMFAPNATFGDGYTEFWRRRFNVEFKIFFENELTYKISRNKANVVLSRAEYALVNLIRDGGLIGPDSFGEAAVRLQIKSSHLREGGGDGEYNWRGFLWMEALTERHFG